MHKHFVAGQAVTWASQAGGVTKQKIGFVEQVVPAGGLPDRGRFEQLYLTSGVGLPRDHVSYVVRVAGKTARSSGKVYWPRVPTLSAYASAHFDTVKSA